MSYQYIYVMKGLSKYYNGKQILKETWLSFLPGAKIGIIGPNGAGKSTLLRIMAGIDKDFTGEAWVADKVKVGYLSQEPALDNTKNVYENILEGIKDKKQWLDEYNEASMKLCEPLGDDEMALLLEKQAELQDKIDTMNLWDFEREVTIAMDALRCPDKDLSIETLSGGEKRRVALCKLLIEKPDMLLLDEPTNHLDAESVDWLEKYLKDYSGTVVCVTHDRYFLDNVSEWILEIDRGECVPWHSNYSSWLSQKQEKLKLEEKEESARVKHLARELEWINQSAKARQAKSKSRITAYNQLLQEGTEKSNIHAAQIIIPSGPRLGDLVIEADHISKTFNDKALFKDFSFRVPPGAIIGIIGPNGAGKTTLFRMITGLEKPDSGLLKIGPSVKLGYVDQLRDALDDKKTVWEEISSGQEEIQVDNKVIKSRAYCSSFGFKGADQQQRVGDLSGGQRNRVHMAKLLKEGANVILLDEPSNDLDVDTLRALEDAISYFPGCVLVISHDRWFLDRIATHIIVFDEENGPSWFEGNYQDYKEYMQQHHGKDYLDKRYKHKKLS